MTSKASAAGEVLAKLKVVIAKNGANNLMDKDYKVPKIEQAKKDLQEQEIRIDNFKQLEEKLKTLSRAIRNEDPAPPLEDPRWEQIKWTKDMIDEMQWEGKEKEAGLQDRYERTVQARMTLLESDLAKVAKIQVNLKTKIGVSQDICDQIERDLEKFENDPGKRMKVIIDAIVAGYKGDQNSVKQKIIEEMDRMPPARDMKGIEEGIAKIKKGMSDWQRSANLEDNNVEQFPNKTACEALERLCLHTPGATDVVRACRMDAVKQDFTTQAKTVLEEMERLDNLTRLSSGDKKTDPATEYKELRESTVAAMGANMQSRQSNRTETRKPCIQFNNFGRCDWGDGCRYAHVRTGQHLNYPSSSREYNDRERSRDKEGDRSPGRDNRGDDRSRGSGGGGGGSKDDRTDKSGGGVGGDYRGGKRDRSRSPIRGNYSSSSSSSSRSSSSSSSGYRNQERDERNQQRSRSNSSVRSNDSDSKATPPDEKKWVKRPDTPK